MRLAIRGFRPRAALALSLACGLAMAGQAQASQFTPEATGWWVVRTTNMANVFSKNIKDGPTSDADRYANLDQLTANLGQACDGLQGEQMKHEYGKVPQWALGAQIDICSGMERWAGKSFMTSRVPCDTVERGLKLLAQAKPGDDPPEVIAAVNALVPTVEALLTAAKAKDQRLGLRCKYAK
ncbi:MAG: hypothetical protein JWP35_3643 [Caulobacter sp.]|nr:hypothetical protein [Caulobacter sp.]